MNAITEDAAARGAKVMLTGQCGNATISLTGRQLLQVLFAQGRLLDWWREARAIRRRAPLRGWLGLVRQSVHPLVPDWVLHLRDPGMSGGRAGPPGWSPISPTLYAKWRSRGELEGLRIHSRAMSGAGARQEAIRMLEHIELGEHSTVSNAHGLDLRDPTKDQDLTEFCVSVPLEQLSRGGTNRWLLRRVMAGELPPEILECQAKGIQAADWFEYLTAELPQLRAEVDALYGSSLTIKVVHVDALHAAVQDWPNGGWADPAVIRARHYRLTRGLAVGMFITEAGRGAEPSAI
jgi:asparagine synthase (glutamine-hydrolysing)